MKQDRHYENLENKEHVGLPQNQKRVALQKTNIVQTRGWKCKHTIENQNRSFVGYF